MRMDEPETWGARSFANTAPTSHPVTTPVADQGYYQPSAHPQYPMVAHHVPPFVPPKSRSPIAWILGFIGIAVFVVIILAVMFVASRGRRGGSLRIDPPAETARANELTLNVSTADRVEPMGSETALVKTFPLSADARVNVRNINGSITVTSWNEPRAEVRAIKKGSVDEGGQPFISNERGNLSIRTGTGRRNSTEVRYEIKLPQNVDQLLLETQNGPIKITGVAGDKINVESTNGTVDLTDVIGLSNAKTTNGEIKVVISEWRDEDLSLSTTNGSVLLQLKTVVNAELDAQSVRGAISVDDSFGVSVERQAARQRASGTIGEGGQRISIRTVTGSIRVTK
jgi:hypothetical protein